MSFFRIASMPIVMLLFAVLFFAAPDVQASSEMTGQAAAERFAVMDTNKDGKVSREAFLAAHPNMKEAAFAAIDTDKDGFICLDEWLAFFKSHGRDDSHSHDPEEPDLACCPPEEHSGSNSGKVPALIMPPPRP
jgi:hypothetical protein